MTRATDASAELVDPADKSWTSPMTLLRLEGLMLVGAGIWVFAESSETWWLFGLLVAPDMSMLGYVRSPTLGAATYNLGHTLIGPALLLGWGVIAGSSLSMGLGAVWLAHVGVDRFAGYGLKYSDGFRHTHLGWIGSASARSHPSWEIERLRDEELHSDRPTTDMEER